MVTMKNRFAALLVMAAVMITGLSSCLKNNATPEPASTVIAFVQGSPAFSMDILFNSQKVNSRPFVFGEPPFPNRFAPANIKIDFNKAGSDSLLTSVTANFDTLEYHTIVLWGTSPVKSYNIREDFSDISREKANVRFFNLVNDTNPVDFFVNTTNASPGRYYEDFPNYTDFQAVDANTVSITVKDQAGTVLATLDNQTLAASYAYSILYMGVKGETGDKKPVLKILQH